MTVSPFDRSQSRGRGCHRGGRISRAAPWGVNPMRGDRTPHSHLTGLLHAKPAGAQTGVCSHPPASPYIFVRAGGAIAAGPLVSRSRRLYRFAARTFTSVGIKGTLATL